jgi:serine phosphatase RsbU (regulator of sigma subunit)
LEETARQTCQVTLNSLPLDLPAGENRREKSGPDPAETHARAALRAGGLGRWEWDLSSGLMGWDEQCSALFRVPAAAFGGTIAAFLDAVHPQDRLRVSESLQRSEQRREDFEESFSLAATGGGPRWLLARGRLLDRVDDPDLMTGVVLDVTRGQLAIERSTRLLEVSAALAAAETPAQVAYAALNQGVRPLGATSAELVMLGDDGALKRLAAMADGHYVAGVGAKQQSVIGTTLAQTARTGQPYPARRSPGGQVPNQLSRRDVAPLSIPATRCFPLTVAGRRVGALSVDLKSPEMLTLQDDQYLATLATQVAQALDRAVLYARSNDVAETLQRQLLPEGLPHLPALELVGRYLPGTAGLAVGGDWYDVIPAGREAVALVLGDVVGKGLRAAGIMSHMRHAINAYAIAGPEPAMVLRRIDTLAETALGESEIVTVLYALLNPATGQLSFASAGHLPPLVLTAGTAEFLDVDPQPPLGVAPLASTTRREQSTVLPPGAALLLYSDGLVERRGRDLDDGLARLRAAAAETYADPDIPLEQMIDALLEQLVGNQRPDDVAVLIARPHRDIATPAQGAALRQG